MTPKRVLIFVLLGPLIGELVLVATGEIRLVSKMPSFIEALKLFPALFSLYPLAFMFGMVPAFLTGCVDELAAKWVPLPARVLLCAVAGYLSAFVVTFSLSRSVEGIDSVGAAGAIAGLACCLIAGFAIGKTAS